MKNLILLISLITSLSCTKERDTSTKVLHLLNVAKITGFDPINISDNNTSLEAGKIYEGLYEFHPLKRPYELMPNLAMDLPTVSTDGLSYTIRLKSGVFFQDDVAFPQGKGREINIDDLIYSLKRLADSKNMAKGWWLLDGRIAGLNEWREKYAKADSANYSDEIEGLKKIDSHSITFKLTKPYPQFIYALSMNATFIVAHEVVKHYGTEFLNHPVGTGPFVLERNDPHQLVYKRNPTFREKFYPSEGAPGDKEAGLLDDAGKKLPLVDKIVTDIIIETQPAWMAFQKGKLDLRKLSADNHAEALNEGRILKPELSNKGMKLFIVPMLDVTYVAFNHQLPIFKNKKVREAMSFAYDRETENKLFFNSTALNAQGVIPPGLAGYNADYKNPYLSFDLEKAKKLLADAGYSEGKGFPELTFESLGATLARQQSEYFAMNMSKLGIKVKVNLNTWPELNEKVHKNRHQIFSMAWVADYPDAENFLGLFYCPNKNPGSNSANYCNPEYDQLFQKVSVMQDSPDRTALYEKLNRMVGEDVAWLFSFHRTRFYMQQGWVRNYKVMEFAHTQDQYLDVDLEKKKELLKKF